MKKVLNSKEFEVGSEVCVQGKIIEHLILNKQEWFTIKLANKQKITLKTEYFSKC